MLVVMPYFWAMSRGCIIKKAGKSPPLLLSDDSRSMKNNFAGKFAGFYNGGDGHASPESPFKGGLPEFPPQWQATATSTFRRGIRRALKFMDSNPYYKQNGTQV
jgi:hypothetical protein